MYLFRVKELNWCFGWSLSLLSLAIQFADLFLIFEN